MFEHSRQAIAGLAVAIGLTLAVGVAAAAGVVPQAGTDSPSHTAAEVAAPPTTPEPPAPVVTEAPPPPAPVATAAPKATPPPTTRAASSRSTASAAPVPAAAPPSAAAAPTSTRRNPSSAEVMSAMQALKARIPMLPLNEAYARDFGNQVCTAFESGQSMSQVVANTMAAASKIPFFSLSPADAQFAVNTAVGLFCPGQG